MPDPMNTLRKLWHAVFRRRAPRPFLHILKELLVRAYALAVLLLVSWAGYLAVSYLMQTVFLQRPVPRRFVEWQSRNDKAALRSASAPGLSTPADRAPLQHYHSVQPFLQPDPRNGCTPSGCHDPLPHSTKMQVPAFANFHASFLTCQMCHAAPDSSSRTVWIGINDAEQHQPPAVLQLLRQLESADQIGNNPPQANATITALLRDVVKVAGNDPSLGALLLQLETSEPLSPVWRQAIDQLARDLPAHARGEYAAKLARQTAPGDYRRSTAQLADIADRYLNSSDATQRKSLIETSHASLLKEPLTCLSCHADKPPLLDYESLGYSPTRARLLENLQLARLMQRIRQGQQFFIPTLMGTDDAK